MEATTFSYPVVRNYIGGKASDTSSAQLEVLSPLDGATISSVPLSGPEELDNAVQAAKNAFPAWSSLTIKDRTQVFYRMRSILERDIEEVRRPKRLEINRYFE